MPRRKALGALGSSALIVLILLVLGIPAGARATPAPLPIGLDGRFVPSLAAPAVAPGGTGAVSWTLANPTNSTITGVVLTLAFYAFNGYPGNATGALPSGGESPTFTPTAADQFSTTLPSLAPGATMPGRAPFQVPDAAPQGTYAVRVGLAFTSGNGSYLLESRGYFDDAVWGAATSAPGNNSTLNLSRLGVSGVVPETGVLVRSDPFTVPIYALLAVGLVLAAAGAYYAFRRGPGSSSGARTPEPPQRAPRAFGKRATNEGDRASS